VEAALRCSLADMNGQGISSGVFRLRMLLRIASEVARATGPEVAGGAVLQRRGHLPVVVMDVRLMAILAWIVRARLGGQTAMQNATVDGASTNCGGACWVIGELADYISFTQLGFLQPGCTK
jgi:hypothetical protein